MTATAASGARARTAPPELLVVPTKLHPPRLREGIVARDGLLDRLRAGRESALTLVCAPAGYGKSTVLMQWAATDGRRTPIAWVSLDEGDSDPLRLWSHVIAALHGVHRRAGKESGAALAEGPRAIQGTVIPTLIEELSGSRHVVLVLEDWHEVRNPVCDATVDAFVARAPDAVQIVVSSRSDPGLSIARLRAHGDLTELRARDLRVSPAEAAELFRNSGVRIATRDARRLTERTEGWLAGLCLAAIVLKEQSDPRRFIKEFTGDSRHVLDYLARDVLDAVDPEKREFMIRTSMLEPLTGPLCDAVLEASGSAAMLAEIAASNLFLFSLDEEGVEYRYHHMFAAMLQRELQAIDPDALPTLHARASVWYENRSDLEPAVEHAIACRDVRRASDLLLRAAQPLVASGRGATVARWLAALSWPEAIDDPFLALIRAQVAGQSTGGRDVVERWLAIAATGPAGGPLGNGIASLRSGIATIRSALLTRGVAVAVQEARTGLDLEPPESPWRVVLLVGLGQSLYLSGHPQEARPPLEEAMTHPLAMHFTPGLALGASCLSLVALAEGDVEKAERVARNALALAEQHRLPALARVNPHLALGSVLAEGSDVHGAIGHLERAVELADPAGPSYWHAHALLRLAAARHRLGDDGGAIEALASARADLDQLPDLGMLEDLQAQTDDELHHRRRREGFLGDELSEAELRVLRGLVDGRSVGNIGHDLWLSPNTVKTHRRSIYRKLGVSTREELVKRARELDLAPPNETDGEAAS